MKSFYTWTLVSAFALSCGQKTSEDEAPQGAAAVQAPSVALSVKTVVGFLWFLRVSIAREGGVDSLLVAFGV